MSLQLRFKIMQFLQFFLWGAWLITFGAYAFNVLHLKGAEIGAIYGAMGIVSLFMPALIGIIADKWINKERVYALLHLGGALTLFGVSQTTDHQQVFWLMFLNSMCYMPTIPLGYTIAYSVLERNKLDNVKQFPKIRVWGTVGFILAMWLVSFLHLELSQLQFKIAAVAQLLLGLYAFSLPKCPPEPQLTNKSWSSRFGLDALTLFKQPQMAIFFIFSALLGMALQMSNTWSDPFLHSFDQNPLYAGTFAVNYPGVLFSLSNISETVFILAIPFFLRNYGIKKVMILSMCAWVLRFGLFALGNPGDGVFYLIISMLVYGCAFDFFNLSGSLFVEMNAPQHIRASAQGLFMMMVNGVGAFFGGISSGWLIDHQTVNDITNWHTIWLICAGIALLMALSFGLIFKYKHDPRLTDRFTH